MASAASPPKNFPTSLLDLRLQPILPSDIPAHESLAAAQGDTAQLPERDAFVETVLDIGYKHITSDKWTNKGAPKSTPPSTAQVQVLETTLNNESWFMRSSVHEDAVKPGTVSWAEFDDVLYKDHSIKEMEYTPDLFDARKIAAWEVGTVGRWSDIVVELYEMVHQLPGPLTHRVFSTLVTRGRLSPTEFITVQTPVDLKDCPAAFYSNGRHAKEGETKQQKAGVLVAEYVSVERCVKLENGDIKWDMGLSSDAKGGLPMFIQKMSIPGTVAKDVGFVVKWAQDRR